MSTTITLAGKGGTGKTTLAALLIRLLSPKGSVLAIDGDPATNLNMALGLPLGETIGRIRETMTVDVQKGRFPAGVAKQDYLEVKVREALVETMAVDLLAMGRPEGPGCYCAANNMLRTSIDRLGRSYDFVVIDCEAGMEHISRQTTRDVDILLLVSDPTLRGVATAIRMKELIGELRTRVGHICLVVNRASGPLPPPVAQAIQDSGLELAAVIPADERLAELDGRGEPISRLPEDSPLFQAAQGLARHLGLL